MGCTSSTIEPLKVKMDWSGDMRATCRRARPGIPNSYWPLGRFDLDRGGHSPRLVVGITRERRPRETREDYRDPQERRQNVAGVDPKSLSNTRTIVNRQLHVAAEHMVLQYNVPRYDTGYVFACNLFGIPFAPTLVHINYGSVQFHLDGIRRDHANLVGCSCNNDQKRPNPANCTRERTNRSVSQCVIQGCTINLSIKRLQGQKARGARGVGPGTPATCLALHVMAKADVCSDV